MSFHGNNTLNFLGDIFNIHIIYSHYICFGDLGGLFTNPVDSYLINTANSAPPESYVVPNYTFYH